MNLKQRNRQIGSGNVLAQKYSCSIWLNTVTYIFDLWLHEKYKFKLSLFLWEVWFPGNAWTDKMSFWIKRKFRKFQVHYSWIITCYNRLIIHPGFIIIIKQTFPSPLNIFYLNIYILVKNICIWSNLMMAAILGSHDQLYTIYFISVKLTLHFSKWHIGSHSIAVESSMGVVWINKSFAYFQIWFVVQKCTAWLTWCILN